MKKKTKTNANRHGGSLDTIFPHYTLLKESSVYSISAAAATNNAPAPAATLCAALVDSAGGGWVGAAVGAMVLPTPLVVPFATTVELAVDV